MAQHGDSFEQALEERYSADSLRAFAKLLGVNGPTRKADIARALADTMLGDDPGESRLKKLWNGLDEIQKAAVGEVLYGNNPAHGGGFNAQMFAGKYGRLPSWHRKDGHSKEPTLLGLFLFDKTSNTRGSIDLPKQLKSRLSEFVPRPREEVLGTVDEPVELPNELPLKIAQTERTAQQELLALLRRIDSNRLHVSEKTKRPSKKGIATVLEILDGNDFFAKEEQKTRYGDELGWIRGFSWPLIVQAAGLAKSSGTKLALTKAGRKSLGQPAADTLRHAWTRWMDTTLIDEFSRIDAIKGQGKRGHMTAVAKRRHAISEVLETCPVNQWIELDEFFRHMQARGKSFEVTHDPWHLYLCDSHYGSLGYAGHHNWSILQGRYVLVLFLEYAATMGLMDIAYSTPIGARDDYTNQWGADDLAFLSRYDGLAYFRINSLGAYILGIADEYVSSVSEPKSAIKLLPNLEVVATSGMFSVEEESFLYIFCKRRSDSVFSLDRSAALAACEKGHRPTELLAFLKKACGKAIPATARDFLKDLVQRSEMLSVAGHSLMVECADEIVAKSIALDNKAGRHCLLAGKKTLVVPTKSEGAFKKAVRDLGYPLRLDDGRQS